MFVIENLGKAKKKKKYIEDNSKRQWKLYFLCLRKGSSKDHERIGCKLCQTDRYCEPHDHEYCCPCEWHHAEHERQLSTIENNIKK